MKKLAGILLAAVLCIGSVMTVFASGSASAGYSIGLSEFTAVSPTAISAYYDSDEILAAVKAAGSDSDSALEEAGVSVDGTATIIGLFNVSDDTYTGGSYTYTLNYADATSSGSYIVLMYIDGKWVQVEVEAGDGYLTITSANGIGPVAIYSVAEASDSDDTTTSSDDSSDSSDDSSDSSTTSEDEETSPTTGETSPIPYIVLIAAIAAAGAVVSGKKRRA